MITAIVPCKGRLDHLKECLPSWLQQDMEILVVDYNCPQGTEKYVNSLKNDRVSCYLEPVSATYWNLSKARNAGWRHAEGDILLFLDADTVLKSGFLNDALSKLEPGTFVTGLTSPPWNGCGCVMLYKTDFEKVRGYNELFEGWGYDDIDFYSRLKQTGLTQLYFDPHFISNLTHADRNEYHSGEDQYVTCNRNKEIADGGYFRSVVKMTRTDIINHLIAKNGYKKYLEIGVRNPADNFDKIKCPVKTGVDPDPYCKTTHNMTSDEFFEVNLWDYDIIFIDGLHHSDQVARDIQNALDCLSEGGTVVCHDINPPEEKNQIVPFEKAGTMNWTGDCWKAWMLFRRDDGLEMKVLDTDWGVGIIRKNPKSKGITVKEELTYENMDANRREWLNLVPATYDAL